MATSRSGDKTSRKGRRAIKVWPYKDVGDFLRQHRRKLGIGSQPLLAAKISKASRPQVNIDGKKISDWEVGRYRPEAAIVPNLLDALEIKKGSAEFDTWERLYYREPLKRREEKFASAYLTEHYLRWVVEQFRRLELYGLHNADRRSDIELEQVFVALRGGLGNPYQPRDEDTSLEELEAWVEFSPAPERPLRQHASSLHSATEIPIDIEERGLDRLFGPRYTETLSVGEALRRERRLVILGEPGSGKTTLLRWIALVLAKTALRDGLGANTWIPQHCVDPNAETEDSSRLFDLGPARLPIYVRIASYLEHRDRAGGSLTFEEHLGFHLSPLADVPPRTEDGEALDPAALNALFRQAIAENRLLLLLDGLDEIANVDDRAPIALAVERFLEGIFFKSANAMSGEPTGGNQVVVTSRIVGYHMAGLGPRSTHMTLEPMGDRAVALYCRLYVRERMRAVRGLDVLDAKLKKMADSEADTIIEESLRLRERGARDLASTPLMLTILIMVARHGGRLPDRRALLYRQAVDHLLDTWRDRMRRTGNVSFPDPERLDAYLCELAFTLQTQSGLGLIERTKARSCLASLGSPGEVSAFIACASEEVGLLTLRGADVIGFHHQTFQEFYAARWLVRRKEAIGSFVDKYSASPRWREPILLALGLLSCDEVGERSEDSPLERVLLQLARKSAPGIDILSSDYLLTCTALKELTWLPNIVIVALARGLVEVRAAAANTKMLPLLDKQLRIAIGCLSEPRARASLIDELRRALTSRDGESADRILAAAALLPLVAHADRVLVKALRDAIPNDSPAWGWPVDSALRFIASEFPHLLPVERNGLRNILLRSPDLRSRFFADPAGPRLAWLLYGGADATLPRKIDALHTDRRFKREMQRRAEADSYGTERQRKIDDLAAEVFAVDTRIKELKALGGVLELDRFHRDCASITPLVVKTLMADASLQTLVPVLRTTAIDLDADNTTRVEAALALLAISEDPLSAFRQHLWKSNIESSVLAALRRPQRNLRLGAAATCPWALKTISANPAFSNIAALVEVFDAIIATHLKCGGSPYNVAEVLDAASPVLHVPAMGEVWRHAFCSDNEDPVYNLAVMLDTIGEALGEPTNLALALLRVPLARMGERGPSGWLPTRFLPRPRSPRQLIAVALDVVTEIPQQFGFAAGWMVAALAPAINAFGLHDEACLIAECQISVPLGGREMALGALRKDNATLPSEGPCPWVIARISAKRGRFQAATSADGANGPGLPGHLPAINVAVEQKAAVRAALQRLPNHSDANPVAIEPAEVNLEAIEAALALELDLAAHDRGPTNTEMIIACLDYIGRAGDPDNCFRLLVRLADRMPVDLGTDFVAAAVAQIAGIAHEAHRASAILAIEPHLERHGVSRERIDATIKNLSPWYREAARGLFSAHLYAALSATAMDVAAKAPICIGVLFQDIETLTGAILLPRERIHANFPWSSAPFAMAATIATNPLSLKTASQIEKLNRGNWKALRAAIVESSQPTVEAMPVIALWERNYPELRSVLALLRSEMVGLSSGMVGLLVDLLEDSDDWVRCRAAMTLYGHEKNSSTMMLASRGGSAIAEEIAERLRELTGPLFDDRQRAMALRWTNEFIVYDDRTSIAGWLADMAAPRLKQNDDRRKIASSILSYINAASPEVQLDLVAALGCGDGEIQLAVLSSLCKLAGQGYLCEEAWEALEMAQSWVPECLRKRLYFLPSLSAFAQSAVRGLEPELRSLFPDDGHPMTLRERITIAGSMQLYGSFYRREIDEAAESVPTTKATCHALVNRLLRELAVDRDDASPLWSRASEALIVTAAVIEKSPQTFYEVVGLPAHSRYSTAVPPLENALVDAVKYHRTFTGRAAAMMLLSQLRYISVGVCEAIASGLRDVSYVQAVTIAGVSRYRFADPAAVEILMNGLDRSDSTALAKALCAQLLMALARSDHVGRAFERQVTQRLAEAVRTLPQQQIFAIVPQPQTSGHVILSLGRLDQFFLAALSDPIETSIFGSHYSLLGGRR